MDIYVFYWGIKFYWGHKCYLNFQLFDKGGIATEMPFHAFIEDNLILHKQELVCFSHGWSCTLLGVTVFVFVDNFQLKLIPF